ncbi:MAG TPA: hypothetical protein PLI57_07460 [Spirochaetota bacterium]|nr:hypothetical protein [Spirochaetota bacterium]
MGRGKSAHMRRAVPRYKMTHMGYITVAATPRWKFDAYDVRIYNRALTKVEIQALYNEGGWIGN